MNPCSILPPQARARMKDQLPRMYGEGTIKMRSTIPHWISIDGIYPDPRRSMPALYRCPLDKPVPAVTRNLNAIKTRSTWALAQRLLPSRSNGSPPSSPIGRSPKVPHAPTATSRPTPSPPPETGPVSRPLSLRSTRERSSPCSQAYVLLPRGLLPPPLPTFPVHLPMPCKSSH